MAARVAGALLALIAAALLVVSVVVTPWWAGHPTFNGAQIKAKELVIGPLGATGCNTGGDGACMSVPVDATFETIGFALTGVAGLLAVLALALAVLALKASARARSFAVFVIVGAVVAGALAIGLVVLGPRVRTEAPLPMSFGLYVFLGSIASAIAASTLGIRLPPVARRQGLQLAASRSSLPAMQPAPSSPGAGVDVQALLADDALRPSSRGPEPRLGRGSPVVQSPGGALPGPSGPLGAIHGRSEPLFSSAPNLRPLYDAAPGQGGTAGFIPSPQQQVPLAPPTPIPRDQISAHAGIPTPASIASERPVTFTTAAPPPPVPAPMATPPPPAPDTDKDLLGTARGMGKPKQPSKPATIPPPNRGAIIRESLKASSIAPIPSLARPPLPARAGAPPSKAPTLATAAVPPPPNTTLAAPPADSLGDDGEAFDAMKTYQHEGSARRPTQPPRRPTTPRPPTRLATEDPVVDTDLSTRAIDEISQTGEPFDIATREHESPAFVPKLRAPSTSATMETAPAPEDGEDSLVSAMPKQATDMDLPTVHPPTEVVASLAPESGVAITPAVDEGPTDREKAKLPISTAPESLPPPTAQQAMASGPSPACPQCEAPMAWVEAHLRFYCKSCKMYF